MIDRRRRSTERVLALAQGAYFSASGLWPLLHLRSFETVTGPKTDRWLVKTVGALLTAIGATLLLAGTRRRVAPELAFLGACSAATLGAVDVVFTARGRVPPIYALDGFAEAGLAAAWSLARLGRARASSSARPLGGQTW